MVRYATVSKANSCTSQKKQSHEKQFRVIYPPTSHRVGRYCKRSRASKYRPGDGR